MTGYDVVGFVFKISFASEVGTVPTSVPFRAGSAKCVHQFSREGRAVGTNATF